MSDHATPCSDAVDAIGDDPDLLVVMLLKLAHHGDHTELVAVKQVLAEAFETVADQINTVIHRSQQ